MTMTIDNNIVQLDKVGRCKKLTATRFATIFNLNAWNTPFSAWCEITKTYEPPFEESQYTLAGKIIEGKVINYLRSVYFMDIKDPTQVYGADYFKKTWGDFFKENKVFGGMWDALGKDFIVEIKTTKRAEDWSENDVPIYYKLQAALYTYLKGFDDFIVTVTFLEDKDYPVLKDDGTWDTSATEKFKPSVDNTRIYPFKMSEEFPHFKEDFIDPAIAWWDEHIVQGVSPQFDEKKDAEILKVIRKNVVVPTDDDINEWLKQADELQDKLDTKALEMKDDEDALKDLNTKIKGYMSKQFRDADKKVEIQSSKYIWNLTKSSKATVDSAKLKADGIYDKYVKTTEVLILKKSLIGKN